MGETGKRQLELYINRRLESRDILLMTHMVLGYPTFEKGHAIAEIMVEAGADIIELQVPCLEPFADGPVIAGANRKVLERGVTTAQCLDFAAELAHSFPVCFVMMGYYETIAIYGAVEFITRVSGMDVDGILVPDLPFEPPDEYSTAMRSVNLCRIPVVTPATSFSRMSTVSAAGSGFTYCVSTEGVSGQPTRFSGRMEGYLDRCRKASRLPIAVGFGVKGKKHVDFLKGRADIAVIGTQNIVIMEKHGLLALERFIKSLL